MMRDWQPTVTLPMEPAPPLKIPLKSVLINIVGALLCGAGVYGLVADNPANRMHWLIAALLIVAGVCLMGYAMVRILVRMRDSSRRTGT